MTGTLCWCCARWGLTVPAARGIDVCIRCNRVNSTRAECDQRHLGEALRAGNAAAKKGQPA